MQEDKVSALSTFKIDRLALDVVPIADQGARLTSTSTSICPNGTLNQLRMAFLNLHSTDHSQRITDCG